MLETIGTNFYSYVLNDPINLSDPLGLVPIPESFINPYTNQTFHLPESTIDYVARRHANVVPTGNTVPRGVFDPYAWQDPNNMQIINRAIRSVLTADPARVKIECDPKTGYKSYKLGSFNVVVRDPQTGHVTSRRPLGSEYGPGGLPVIEARILNVVVDPNDPITPNKIINFYPQSH